MRILCRCSPRWQRTSAHGIWRWPTKKQIGKKTRAAGLRFAFGGADALFDRGIYANQMYLKKDLEYDATLSVMTRVVDRIEQVEGYIPGETPSSSWATFNGQSWR